ncbi:MAG: hypothetical protein ABEJ59_01870 [Halanaeroarchaeum sp.]
MVPNRTRSVATVLALLLVASVMAPGALALSTDSLSIAGTQDPATGQATVTVTDNGTAVANASVTVESAGNYTGTGNYTTDENGSVTLPDPATTVDVTITATTDNVSKTTTGTLVPQSESVAVNATVQSDGSGLVTVTQYGEPAANATVNVSVGENASYTGTGTYTTDENGTVTLPAADHRVDATVGATANGAAAEDTISLPAPSLGVSVSQATDGSVTITVNAAGEPVDGATVDVAGDYTDAGSYTTDNGTVSLGAPATNTTITVTATYQNRTAETTADLTVAADGTPNNDFGDVLVQFIRFLKSGNVDGPLGQQISAFVHEHNPSSADDVRGPPEHANGHGPEAADNETEHGHGAQVQAQENETEHGPPAFANASTDREHEHEGSANATATGNRTQTTEQDHDREREHDREHEQETTASGDSHGPPEHANGHHDD